MGVQRKLIKEGNGKDAAQAGDMVTIEYTGYLYDPAQASNDNKGKQFDTTTGRGPFHTQIGVGKVIKGWDEGVPQMTLGERAILTISSDYAYGERGFYDLIPPHSTLVFEVELKAINDKSI